MFIDTNKIHSRVELGKINSLQRFCKWPYVLIDVNVIQSCGSRAFMIQHCILTCIFSWFVLTVTRRRTWGSGWTRRTRGARWPRWWRTRRSSGTQGWIWWSTRVSLCRLYFLRIPSQRYVEMIGQNRALLTRSRIDLVCERKYREGGRGLTKNGCDY